MPNPIPPNLSLSGEPDPHGQAALLLVESLINGLIGHRLLSVAAGVDVIEVALDAQTGLAEVGQSAAHATTLLESLLRSLALDLPRP